MQQSDAVDAAGRDDRQAVDVVWKEWMRQLGRHNRRVREFLGISQEELAQHAGVSQGAVSRFEGGRGINTPFLAILRIHLAIAGALRTLDPATLDEQVKKFLKHMEFFCVPATPGCPPAPAGVPIPDIQLTADPNVERLVRQYRAMPETQRRAFIAALLRSPATPASDPLGKLRASPAAGAAPGRGSGLRSPGARDAPPDPWHALPSPSARAGEAERGFAER